MNRFKKKVSQVTFYVLILFAAQSFFVPSKAQAQDGTVKYVYSIDYPMGQKDVYLKWVQSVAHIAQNHDGLKSIKSYDNYFGASPHRFIEFEFDNMKDAADYFERPEFQEIMADVANRGINSNMVVLKELDDYTRKRNDNAPVRAIKYVYSIDYPVGQKDAYLKWVQSVAHIAQNHDGLKSIKSYDNYFGASPHRFIEFEFDNMKDAADYFERPEFQEIMAEVVNRGVGAAMTVLKLREDY